MRVSDAYTYHMAEVIVAVKFLVICEGRNKVLKVRVKFHDIIEVGYILFVVAVVMRDE